MMKTNNTPASTTTQEGDESLDDAAALVVVPVIVGASSITVPVRTTSATAQHHNNKDDAVKTSSVSFQPLPPPPLSLSLSSLSLLDTTFFWYQNNVTGQVSTTPLSLRQLCRMIGMMMMIDRTTTTTTTTTTIRIRHLSPDTQILVVHHNSDPETTTITTTTNKNNNDDDDNATPSPQPISLPHSWQPLRTIPVLREAVTLWYYYYYHRPNHPTVVALPNSTLGPVTCRELAHIVHSLPSQSVVVSSLTSSNNNDDALSVPCLSSTSSSSSNAGVVFYVSSTITDMTWTTIDELPHLQMALAALQQPPLPPKEQEQQYPTVNTSTTTNATAIANEINPSSTNHNQTNQHDDSILSTPEDTIQAELEAFLQSTSHVGSSSSKRRYHNHMNAEDDDDDACSYESDNGTRYIQDSSTGNWIHEALQQRQQQQQQQDHEQPQQMMASKSTNTTTDNTTSTTTTMPTTKKKNKKAKFANKYSRNWIYVTGIPTDGSVTEAEVAAVFGKAGLLDLDPVTQLPKIKLYRYNNNNATATTTSHSDHDNHPPSVVGSLKGDASICYARPESVALAITLLDDTPFRYESISSDGVPPVRMTVQAAKFEPHPSLPDINTTNHNTETTIHRQRHHISNTQRKVAKLATKQAMDWDESGNYNNGRITGGKKGLCIIVLKHTFDPNTLAHVDEGSGENYFAQLEQELRTECEQFGTVEKITFFTSHPEGVVIVKFVQPLAASDAVQRFNRQLWKDRQLMATFWDGVTDYTTKKDPSQEEEEMAVREEEFGDWLETQQLPEELQLQTCDN